MTSSLKNNPSPDESRGSIRKYDLTAANYFSLQNQKRYMGSSQFKAFRKCEAAAMAQLESPDESPSKDMLVGSYVDAYFTEDVKQFQELHPTIFKQDGTLKADFKRADHVISRICKDEMMEKYLSGDHQVIMSGEIAKVPFKIKIDSYHPDRAIVDLKIMKDLETIWSDDAKKRIPFVEFWGYDLQGAIYQEIVRQNTGRQLPFILACATKQTSPRIILLEIPQNQLNEQLEIVREFSPRYDRLKQGDELPEYCGKCDHCAAVLPVDGVVSYQELS